jgi:hypothetical protein
MATETQKNRARTKGEKKEGREKLTTKNTKNTKGAGWNSRMVPPRVSVLYVFSAFFVVNPFSFLLFSLFVRSLSF